MSLSSRVGRANGFFARAGIDARDGLPRKAWATLRFCPPYIKPVAGVGWVEQRDTHRLDYIVGYRYAPPNLQIKGTSKNSKF